jgi:hypothetical protein
MKEPGSREDAPAPKGGRDPAGTAASTAWSSASPAAGRMGSTLWSARWTVHPPTRATSCGSVESEGTR